MRSLVRSQDGPPIGRPRNCGAFLYFTGSFRNSSGLRTLSVRAAARHRPREASQGPRATTTLEIKKAQVGSPAHRPCAPVSDRIFMERFSRPSKRKNTRTASVPSDARSYGTGIHSGVLGRTREVESDDRGKSTIQVHCASRVSLRSARHPSFCRSTRDRDGGGSHGALSTRRLVGDLGGAPAVSYLRSVLP